MNHRNSTIELPNSFQAETWQRRVAGKSYKKIRYTQKFFIIRAILMVIKYMHENLKHTVKKHMAKKIKKHSHFEIITTKNRNHFFRFHIKQYWHFNRVTPKRYYTLFQTSNNTDIFRELLVNNTKHFCKVYIKQYWHFQRVPSKLIYGRNFFQSTYQTISDNTQYHTIMEWHFQRVTTKQHWLIENSYLTVFTLSQIYYQTIVNTILRVWMDNWTDNFSNGKSSTRSEKSKHTHIKQITLPSNVLEVTSLYDWSLMALWKKMA